MDSEDYDQRTPLHLASAFGHLEVVKYLISTGCKVSPVDRWGATPLNDAKKVEIQEFLKSKGGINGVHSNF